MLIWFFRLFESKAARNVRLARERAERRQVAREAELAIIEKNARDRLDMRYGPTHWTDSISK